MTGPFDGRESAAYIAARTVRLERAPAQVEAK